MCTQLWGRLLSQQHSAKFAGHYAGRCTPTAVSTQRIAQCHGQTHAKGVRSVSTPCRHRTHTYSDTMCRLYICLPQQC
jgi:hypothetical protein